MDTRVCDWRVLFFQKEICDKYVALRKVTCSCQNQRTQKLKNERFMCSNDGWAQGFFVSWSWVVMMCTLPHFWSFLLTLVVMCFWTIQLLLLGPVVIVCSSPVPSTFSISSYSDIIKGDKTYITDTVVLHSIQHPAWHVTSLSKFWFW